MNPTFSLGRIVGICIGVNWSWLIIFGLIAWSLESTVFPGQDADLSRTTYVVMGLVATFFLVQAATADSRQPPPLSRALA